MDKSNKPYGFFQDTNGNKSSARLLAFILIVTSLVFAQQFIIFAIIQKINVLLISSAVATTVTTISGGAMLYLFGKQKAELEN
jgi:hypothetical protein